MTGRGRINHSARKEQMELISDTLEEPQYCQSKNNKKVQPGNRKMTWIELPGVLLPTASSQDTPAGRVSVLWWLVRRGRGPGCLCAGFVPVVLSSL